MSPLQPEILTWTALLGRWMEFARASVVLPDDANGRAWKKSVVPMIELQAVTFALAELASLPPEEQSIALDKAEIIITRADRAIQIAWVAADRTPESIGEIVRDAQLALRAAQRIIAADAPQPPTGDDAEPSSTSTPERE